MIALITPPLLELQGFYLRPLLFSRKSTLWQLVKTATWATVALIIVLFFRKAEGARGVLVLYGPLAIVIVFLKEEGVRRWGLARRGGQAARRRIILIGSQGAADRLGEDTARLEKEIAAGRLGDVESPRGLRN